MTSNGRLNLSCELVRTWKEEAVSYFKTVSQLLHGKTTKNLHAVGRESNPGSFEYEAVHIMKKQRQRKVKAYRQV
jgi:hypothetical protein